MVRKLLVSVTIIGSLALAGCHTLRGVGQDIQSVPDCVQGRTC
jgi:predicted small secreted protein